MKKLIILISFLLLFAPQAYANPFMQIMGAGVAASGAIVKTVIVDTVTAAAWATSTAYEVGNYRTANTNKYVCTAGGTSASSGTGPSGYGAGISDGTVTWDFVAHYAGLQAALTGEAGGSRKLLTSADLVDNDEQLKILLRATGGNADTSSGVFDFHGDTFVTDATRNLWVVSDIGHRSTTGVWDDTKYRMYHTGWGGALTDIPKYTLFESIQLDKAHETDTSPTADLTDGVIVKNCILKKTCPAGIGWRVSSGAAVEVINSIFYGNYTEIIRLVDTAAGSGLVISGSILHGGSTMAIRGRNLATVRNSVVFGSGDDFHETTVTSCASDDGDGTNSVTLVDTDDYAAEFTDITTNDYRPVSGAGTINAGAALGTGYNFTINGVSRPQGAGWDIGAFEYVE